MNLEIKFRWRRNESPFFASKSSFPLQKVFFSININAFPDVDSAGFKVKSDYDLRLRWYDPRLKFQDLHNLTEYNDLGPADRTYLWSPRLEISNALGESVSPGSLVDDASSVRVIKEELEAMPEDFSLSREGEPAIFEG